MKYVINEYKLFSPKIKNKIDILCITDIHSNYKKLEDIGRIIKRYNVKYLLISGDLVDTIEDDRNENLLKIIKDISKTTYIYIVKGNHDMIKSRKKKKKNITLSNNFYKKLSEITNIKVFNNNIDFISIDKNINLNSLTLPYKWYKERENTKLFCNYVDEDIVIDESKFNIFLLHTPIPLIKDNEIIQNYNYIKSMDLILCGHMHGGLKPICFRRKNHKGIVGPCKTILPKVSYGYYESSNSSLILSGGVTKISYLKLGRKVSEFIDNMFVSEMELIHLEHGNKHHLELSNTIRIKKEQI